MKKILLFLVAVISLSTSFAQRRIHKITVSNFQFSPATVNAKVGDTLLWVWKSGTHTTTSLTIPPGAKAWNAPINSTKKRFGYIITKTGVYNYNCSIHPTTMTGKINVTATLAAGLSDLSISTENNAAVLHWVVNNNTPVSYFSVQRSNDGNVFKEIAQLKPSALKTYNYKDEAISPDKYTYYQLKLYDKKGNTELSEIKMFTQQQRIAKLITSLSPNPISSPGHLMLQFNADADGKMLVKLFSQSGKLVKQTEMAANKGLNNGHFHLGALTPGNYYVVCTLGNKTERYNIVYQ